MNPMGQWLRNLSGMMASNSYSEGMSNERDPAKIAYVRRLQKAMKQKDHLDIPFSKLTVIVFDIETTGFHPQKGDRILSIGAKKIHGDDCMEVGSFYSLLKSEQPPSEEITSLTGITMEQLRSAPDAEDVLHDFFKFIGNHTLVAHHASHETKFMQNITWSLFKTKFEHRIIDTSFLTRLIPSMKNLITLEECCDHVDVNTSNRHHALHDANMTAKLWCACMKEVNNQGLTCLKDVYAQIAKNR